MEAWKRLISIALIAGTVRCKDVTQNGGPCLVHTRLAGIWNARKHSKRRTRNGHLIRNQTDLRAGTEPTVSNNILPQSLHELSLSKLSWGCCQFSNQCPRFDGGLRAWNWTSLELLAKMRIERCPRQKIWQNVRFCVPYSIFLYLYKHCMYKTLSIILI